MAKVIAIGALGLKFADILATMAEGETKSIAKIYGRTAKYKVSADRKDPTRQDIKFMGAFEVAVMGGAVSASKAAFLPSQTTDALRTIVDTLKSGEFATFGVEIAIKKENGKASFGVAPIVAPAKYDVFTALRNSMSVEGKPTQEPAKPAKAASVSKKASTKSA